VIAEEEEASTWTVWPEKIGEIEVSLRDVPDLRNLLKQQILSSIPAPPKIVLEDTITQYFSQYDSHARMNERCEKLDDDTPMHIDDGDAETIKDLTEDGVSQDTINKIMIRQTVKKDIRRENMASMEEVEHLKHIETH
jgi:hypothetical protein